MPASVPGLRPIRERQRLSQAVLGKIAGLPASSIAHFEAGNRAPSVANLVRLADALGCTTDELLGREVPSQDAADLVARLRQIRRLCENV